MTDLPAQISFEILIQSDLFTFYIGEQKRPFTVHSKAIAATSHYFDRLVHGGLSEAQTRSAELVDVDPETFIRFLEYAYRNDYTAPPWAQDSSPNGLTESTRIGAPPMDGVEPVSTDEDVNVVTTPPSNPGNNWGNSRSAPSDFGALGGFGSPAPPKNIRKLKPVPQNPRTLFNKREYIPTPSTSNPAPSNTSPKHNFAPVFLAHARLYTLADMRMVHPLKNLVLHKLHSMLVNFELFPERLGDVVELARYAYENGEDRSEDGRIDALRDLVVHYIACEMKVLGKHADFRNLMDGGGEFPGDFWDVFSRELL